MSLLRETFRLWWQKPRKISEVEEDRSVSFLELFYDLVYVVIVAELTHMLVGHFSLSGIVGFVALFALVWWAWINGTFYHELHGNYDIRTRVFTFLQMFALAGMAMFAPMALDGGARGFSISYAIFQAIVTFLWWRVGVHDENHRPMTLPYVTGFLITTGIFFAAAFTAAPVTYYLWAVATLISLTLPFLLTQSQKKLDQEVVEATMRVRPSLVERFGLLTIIVLGEVVVAVVAGVLHHHDISVELLLNAAMGLGVAMAMWWIYFDFGSHHVPIQRTWPRLSWMYLHLPMTASIALTGAGVLMLFEHHDGVLTNYEQWFLVVPVSLFLFAVMLLVHTLDIDESHTDIHRKGGIGSFISGVAMLGLGFLPLTGTQLLLLMNLLLLFPIFLAVRMWVRGMQHGHDH